MHGSRTTKEPWAIAALCEKSFARALARLEGGCCGDDQAVVPALEALRLLHEVAGKSSPGDRQSWFAAAGRVADGDRYHPLAVGLATGLLYLARERGEADVASMLALRLSAAHEPRAGRDAQRSERPEFHAECVHRIPAAVVF